MDLHVGGGAQGTHAPSTPPHTQIYIHVRQGSRPRVSLIPRLYRIRPSKTWDIWSCDMMPYDERMDLIYCNCTHSAHDCGSYCSNRQTEFEWQWTYCTCIHADLESMLFAASIMWPYHGHTDNLPFGNAVELYIGVRRGPTGLVWLDQPSTTICLLLPTRP